MHYLATFYRLLKPRDVDAYSWLLVLFGHFHLDVLSYFV